MKKFRKFNKYKEDALLCKAALLMMKKVKILTTISLLVALDVVFTRFFSYMLPGNLDRLSLQYIPHALGGLLFGPFYAAIACVVGDILGMFINSAGLVFTPMFTASAAVRGLLYGLLLYKKPVTLKRCILAVSVVTLVVDLGLNPIWMNILYDQAYLPILLAKIPVRVIFAPLAGMLLYPLLRRLSVLYADIGKN